MSKEHQLEDFQLAELGHRGFNEAIRDLTAARFVEHKMRWDEAGDRAVSVTLIKGWDGTDAHLRRLWARAKTVLRLRALHDPNQRPATSQNMWRTKSGEERRIVDMTDAHIIAVLRMWFSCGNLLSNPRHAWVLDEAQWRGLDWREKK